MNSREAAQKIKVVDGSGADGILLGVPYYFPSSVENAVRFYDLDELIEKIEAVTVEDLQTLANEFFQPESVAVTALGNLTGLKLSRGQLAC